MKNKMLKIFIIICTISLLVFIVGTNVFVKFQYDNEISNWISKRSSKETVATSFIVALAIGDERYREFVTESKWEEINTWIRNNNARNNCAWFDPDRGYMYFNRTNESEISIRFTCKIRSFEYKYKSLEIEGISIDRNSEGSYLIQDWDKIEADPWH